MFKAPTKHGLDRKYKPWRRGKGKSASGSNSNNKRSSLKQQLRGHERLLLKLNNGAKDKEGENVANDDVTEERKKELQTKIDTLKKEINAKQLSTKEKQNAEKSHGQRFLDRQRLTRLEKKARQNADKAELYKVALDQVYVAHHPSDVKYIPLFTKGQQRVVDQSRQLLKRAITRKRILKEISTTKTWVSDDLYKLLPLQKEWTIQDEEQIFGGSVTRKNLIKEKIAKTQATKEDSRFNSLSAVTGGGGGTGDTKINQFEQITKLADQLEAELDKEKADTSSSSNDGDDESSGETEHKQESKTKINIEKSDDNDNESSTSSTGGSSSSSDDGGDDDVDPLKTEKKNETKTRIDTTVVVNNKKAENQKSGDRNDDDDDDSSSSSSSSSSDDEDDDNDIDPTHLKDTRAKETSKKNANDEIESEGSSSSSDSSSDDSDSDDDDDDDDIKQNNKKRKPEEDHNHDESDGSDNDDFLMDADDDDDDIDEDGENTGFKKHSMNVFDKTKIQEPAFGQFRGDKSKGWATQRQHPGKKRRIARR